MGLITHFVTYFLLVHGYALFLAFSAIFLQKTSFLVSKFTVFENQRLCAPKIWQNCPIIACKIYSPWNVDDFRFLKLPKMLSGLRDMPIFIKVGVFAEKKISTFLGENQWIKGAIWKAKSDWKSICYLSDHPCVNLDQIVQIFLAKWSKYFGLKSIFSITLYMWYIIGQLFHKGILGRQFWKKFQFFPPPS